MKQLATLEARLARLIENVMIVLFLIFLIIVVTKVLMRPFDAAIYGVDELVKIAFLATSALGGAVAISRQEHIALTVFIESLPRGLTLAFYILGLALVAFMNGALVYLSFDWIAGPGRNIWQPFGMPQAYVFVVVPIACGLGVLFSLVKIVLALGGEVEPNQLWMPRD